MRKVHYFTLVLFTLLCVLYAPFSFALQVSGGPGTADLTSFDNTISSLPDDPDDVQEAIEKIAALIDALDSGTISDLDNLPGDDTDNDLIDGDIIEIATSTGPGVASFSNSFFQVAIDGVVTIVSGIYQAASSVLTDLATGSPTGTYDLSGATVNYGLEDGDIPAAIARDSELPTPSDIAYDATTWDGNTDAATKNAIRDKIESMGGGSGAPTDASYLTAGSNATLSDERVVSADGLSLVQSADFATMRTSMGLGTMATQAADSVNIDGGAIDGTPIGANSAAAATFTTVTASAFESNAADGDHYTNLGNTNDYDETKSDGDMWYNRTSDLLKIYDGAEDDIIITDDAFTGNTETGITVTPQTDGTVDFEVSAALASIAGLTEAAGSLIYATADNTYAVLGEGSNDGYVLAINTSTHAPYWKADATGAGGDQLVDIVATSPVLVNGTTNVDDALPGSDSDITFSVQDASTAQKGVAQFSSDNFAASSGTITVKDDGIAAAEIADFYGYELLPMAWTTGGVSAPDALDSATRGPWEYRTFASDADEDVNFIWQIPSDATVGGSANNFWFRVHYLITASTAPTTDEGVAFSMAGVAMGDSDATNAAKGSAVTVTDDLSSGFAQWDYVVSDWSGAVTLTGAGAGEMVEWNFERTTGDAADDYAQLVGVAFIEIRYVKNPAR